jgi:hypothetical protein
VNVSGNWRLTFLFEGRALEPGHHRTLHSDTGNFASFEILASTELGAGSELPLTDGLRQLLKQEKIYGYTFEGKRHDTGDKLGFLKATLEFALKRDNLGADFRKCLKKLQLLNRKDQRDRKPTGR